MKHAIRIVIGTIILGILLGACTRADSSMPNNVKTKLDFIHLYNQVHGPTDSDTIDFLWKEAELSCARLGNGYSLPDVWEVGVQDGMSSDQSATVINSAVLTFCPQMQARLSDEAARHLEQGNTTWAPIVEGLGGSQKCVPLSPVSS